MDSQAALKKIADSLNPVSQLPREGFERRSTGLSDETRDALREYLHALASDDFDEAIRAGCVTFGLVKPHISKWSRPDLDIHGMPESLALEKVLGAIQNRVNLCIGLNVKFTGPSFPHFRGANEMSLKSKRSKRGFPSLWEEERALLASGASTALVIWGDDIVRKWRRSIGNTYPSKADKETLRYQFAHTPQNNLFHGADPEDHGGAYPTVKHEYTSLQLALGASYPDLQVLAAK